jgi:hypothetical protein
MIDSTSEENKDIVEDIEEDSLWTTKAGKDEAQTARPKTNPNR